MSVKDRAELGEKLIFGDRGLGQGKSYIGKAQCPLCHGFQEGFNSERAPNLWGIPYRQRTSLTPIEYLAESHACPSCYVVGGFDVRGTEGRESPMPVIHKPPISLSIDELIAVDTWLFYREGIVPPSPEEIEQAYRKFIPESEWPEPSRKPEVYPAMDVTPAIAYPETASSKTGKERIDVIFTRALCFACHTIPGIPGATGVVGPKLTMKTIAPKRLKDPAYQGKATNVPEYVVESIVNPGVYVDSAHPDNIMPKDYGETLNAKVIDKMADYLSQLEEGVEPPETSRSGK